MLSSKLGREIRGSTFFGIAIIVIFIGGGIAWSVQAPLAGAVIAPGVIGFKTKKKTVQHLEGGIIKEILVKSGDIVNAGATIMVLDDTRAKARADELRNRIRTLAAEEARLNAERLKAPKIIFDHPLLQAAGDAELATTLEQQINHFKARAGNLKTRRDIFKKRIRQLNKQKIGLNKQLDGVRKQLILVLEEAVVVEDLVKKGYDRRPRLLAILRTQAQLVASEGELIASIARNAEAVGETRIRIINLDTDLLQEVDSKLTQVHSERVGAEKQYREIVDRLSRTRVVSPIKGVILDVRFKTVGGVIRPGEPILDIVPANDELVVNARIRPTDVDEVALGSPASVMFSAFQRRYLKRIDGEVVHLSADAFQDKDTGASYFLADIKIDRDQLKEIAPDLVLAAGMPAEVFIKTTERTLADYLIQPIKRTFERAFRES